MLRETLRSAIVYTPCSPCSQIAARKLLSQFVQRVNHISPWTIRMQIEEIHDREQHRAEAVRRIPTTPEILCGSSCGRHLPADLT